ncbi:MAG: site-specific DNA-methyltransferase [Polyangiaceae bacterium]|nr:site-specific DNA-methyltransferase [Polyangiaceae bacterium]
MSGGGAVEGAGAPAWALSRRDAVEWLRELPARSVDLLITDPPYESLERHRAIGTTTRLKVSKASSNAWFSIFPNARFPELFAEAYRVLARDAHLYLFVDQETLFAAKPAAEAAGFKFWKALVWDKGRLGLGYHYRSRHELILFLEKGKRRLRDLSIPDVLCVRAVRGGYPAEKPVPLVRTLVEQSSPPGALVADPFFGSGAVGVAALAAGRRFTGTDLSADAVALATRRLEEAAAR